MTIWKPTTVGIFIENSALNGEGMVEKVHQKGTKTREKNIIFETLGGICRWPIGGKVREEIMIFKKISLNTK